MNGFMRERGHLDHALADAWHLVDDGLPELRVDKALHVQLLAEAGKLAWCMEILYGNNNN